ncbi:MAG: PadR family transcriptional regulator [Alphaproteobacteria bacterium]|nr:PadR family transcriptional regulator [Alphaproteobacteria bacterium]
MDSRTLCLGLLAQGAASGYELKKLLEGPLRHFVDASFGSIYPALARLAAEGLVACTEQAQDRRPDKKVYQLTPQGRLALLDALINLPGRDRFRSDFAALMLFADLLPVRHLSELIDEKLAEQEAALAELAALREGGASLPQEFVAGLAAAMIGAARDYLDENRHMIESHALQNVVTPSAT